ncbi:9889_t:CDS:1, partial [Racocetra fulgida]
NLLKADKFYKETFIEEMAYSITYLYAFNQNSHNFLEESLTILQQRKIYRELYNAYKKALNKALTS